MILEPDNAQPLVNFKSVAPRPVSPDVATAAVWAWEGYLSPAKRLLMLYMARQGGVLDNDDVPTVAERLGFTDFAVWHELQELQHELQVVVGYEPTTERSLFFLRCAAEVTV